MNNFTLIVMAVIGFLPSESALPAAQIEAPRVRVEPRESDALFANPGMGWQTFGRFADQDKNLEGLPSASAYFRFYWREVESQAGQIDFPKFDDLLAHARRAGQKLAFRIMCTGSGEYMDVPVWLKDQGCLGVEFTYGGRKHWVPNFTDKRFEQAHFRLIRQLGEHYDGHPDMDLLDIGSVGLWGEWHMSGTTQVDTEKPVLLPPLESRMAIIDAWCKAFSQTSKVILIGSEEGMSRASHEPYGWRADCLGDMGGFSKTWNHMVNFYLQQLTNTGALDAWKTAPVAFESCWDMRKWKEASWDIPFIFDYALRCHSSYMNNKSAPLPEGARGEVERFLRRLGYRLVIRNVDHPATARPNDEVAVNIDWENVGVAPPYRDYRVAVQLRPEKDPKASPIVSAIDHSIRGWLPGRQQTESMLRLPASVPSGRYTLAIGVVELVHKRPSVRLAIAGRDTEGWYPVSHLEIAP
ncbi:MAG TPA: DUF4832 domain-containing protein [Candidatus Paceibacterota bacterium]|nr:DUF4832 domain-containing protein [Candidatus Paceibacterota bacterium]